MDVKDKGWNEMDEIHLALDRDKWLALMSTVINFLVLQKREVPK
jgi:hypothetical protein